MAQVQSVRIKTDGATLAIRHFPGSGDPIVLLHGGPGMGDYFGSFPEVLSPPYSVVSYNQRGCEPSSCDGSFEVERQVGDLDAVRLHLKADRMHLFGHSWGGLLAQLYAKAHPQHVASLVLCCSMGNTGSKVAAMESKGIAERVMAKPKRSPAAWVFAGTLMQLPGKLGDLGFGLIPKQLLPNYVVRPELAPMDRSTPQLSRIAKSLFIVVIFRAVPPSPIARFTIAHNRLTPIPRAHQRYATRFPSASASGLQRSFNSGLSSAVTFGSANASTSRREGLSATDVNGLAATASATSCRVSTATRD